MAPGKLEVAGLAKSFGGNRVLDSASLEPLPGRINLLMGSNGSGKSTLVNCITGLFAPDSGTVSYEGADITGMRADRIYGAGIIRTFQTPRLFENLSVLENLLAAVRSPGEAFRASMLPSRWRRAEAALERKAMTILESFGLGGLRDNSAYDLSGGQIKLLELGKVLMADSGLVFLDEPIAGVNPVLAHKIFEGIARICREHGTTFLVIEHRLDIALRYVDCCFVLHGGRIIASGPPDTIMDDKTVIESYLGR